MSQRQRWDTGLALLALLAIIASAGAAIAVPHVSLKSLVAPALLVVLVAVARQEWGSVAVAAVPFLLPGIRSTFGLAGPVELAIVTLALAIVYWNTLGRPRLSRWAIYAAGTFSIANLLLSFAHGQNMQQPIFTSLVAAGGVVFGACLASSATARFAFGCGCVPLAVLAVAEVAGVHNPWPGLVHATKYLKVSQITNSTRAQSTFGHPLIAGACLAVSSAVMLQSRTRYCLGVAAVLAAGAIATVSRSAILAMAVAVAVSLLLADRRLVRLAQVAAILVVAVILVGQIPALKESVQNRVTQTSFTYTDQPVRAYAITRLRTDLLDHTDRILLGGGNGAAVNMLTAIGGISGFDIFDNEYVTSVYELGLIPLALIAVFAFAAVVQAPAVSRHLGLPAVAAVACVMFFTDGLGWLSLSFISWAALGLATAPVASARAIGT